MKYEKGMRFVVIKTPARLSGMQPNPGGGLRRWSRKLSLGDVITCQGTSMTIGDGVPIVKWSDSDGKEFAIDCEFNPSTGGMWNSKPADGYLAPEGELRALAAQVLTDRI